MRDLDAIDANLNATRGRINAVPVELTQPAPLPAPQPAVANVLRPFLDKRYLGAIGTGDSYQVFVRLQIRNGNLEYVEEYGKQIR